MENIVRWYDKKLIGTEALNGKFVFEMIKNINIILDACEGEKEEEN
jgi:hypothetical protein